jgi:YYY domain-containing protein
VPTSRPIARAILGLVLLAGAFFRFQKLNWDESSHLHPDERFISMVEEKLAFPKSLGEYLDSAHSPLNPYNRGNDTFVYGTFPIFLTKAIAAALHRDGYDGAYMIGRALSALFDLLTVWLVYRLCRRFAGRKTSLAAASLLAFCPLAIQLSHFWAVDTFLATFATLTLLGCVRLARGRSGPWGDAGTGLALGLAVACKITGLALFAAVGVALLLRLDTERRAAGGSASRALRRAVVTGAITLAAALVAIRLALPYAFLGWRIDPRYIRDLKQLAAISSSVAGFPPALQWAGRTVFFPVENFVLWGAAPFFGLTALAALVWTLFELRRRERRDLAPLAVYAVFVALYHGLTLVKSIRYFYPAYPTLAVLSGLLLARLFGGPTPRRGRARRLVAGAVLAGNVLAAVAFTSVYRHPHTRPQASRWIYAHVPPPARFANEAWDDGQPIPLPGTDASAYAGPVLELYDPDSREKVEKILRVLSGTDWIAVTSNRVYGNVTRVPAVFPMTVAYYRALFGGALGFEQAADITSYPSLGPLSFDDGLAEEQFTVYDHPRVVLFKKTPAFSAARARAILLAAMPSTPPTIFEWEKWPRARRKTTGPVVPPHLGKTPARESLPPLADRQMGSITAAILWYAALALVGLAALPLTWLVFSRLQDRGLGFARVVGLAVAAYALNFSVARAGVSNGRPAAGGALLLLAAAGAAIFLRRRAEILSFLRTNRRALWQGEAVFAVGFVLFVVLRAFNPEITWGEKPMDFSILNILVRTRTLPASDPWFAGAPLGYYTFGQEIVAFLTLLTGISTRQTFNLAFGLLGGALLQGAFSLTRNWARRLAGGLAGAAFVTLAGNLAGLREWLLIRRPQHQPLDWHYFWATSRVVRDTINEYPLWSLLFADLHAHVLSMPLLLLFLAQALQFVRVHADPSAMPRTRWLAAAALGAIGAAEALTNAWDAPLLAGLLALTALAAALAGSARPGTALVRVFSGLVIAGAAALAFARPLWPSGGKPPAWGRNLEKGASGLDVATIFGLFFFLALAWWLTAAADRWRWKPAQRIAVTLGGALLFVAVAVRSADLICLTGVLLFAVAFFAFAERAEDRLAAGLAGSAFFLVLFTQRFYLYDRMNTFFKLYLESWILFAVATAALAFRPPEARGSISRWPAALRGIAALLAILSLFTTVTVARGALDDARPSRKEGAPIPTLDGLAYLAKAEPGEYKAVTWLRRVVSGTPVLVEAQGPSYQDFGRVSMYTGLPTVLGWEYHVQQRGNSPEEIARRKVAVEAIYSNPSADAIEGLLRRYHVAYVYVGPLERRTYPRTGLAKFDAARNLFPVAYENPQVRIYRVAGADAEDVIAPERETLPAEGAAPAQATEVLEPEEAPILSGKPAPDRAPFADLKEPRDAAVDERGRLWVADFGHSRVRLFDADGGYLGGWGGRGDATYNLRELCGVATRGNDLFLADTWNGRVSAFTLDGAWKATAHDLYGPRGLAAAADGSVWVTDTGNHRVVRFDANLANPRAVGKKGTGPLEFDGPVGIAAGPSGKIFVCDTGNRRIQVLDPQGSFLRALPVPGWKEGCEPDLEADEDDLLYVADPPGNAVLVLDGTGQLRARWEADDSGHRFAAPTGIAIDRKNRILYVVNSGDNFISKKKLLQGKGN